MLPAKLSSKRYALDASVEILQNMHFLREYRETGYENLLLQENFLMNSDECIFRMIARVRKQFAYEAVYEWANLSPTRVLYYHFYRPCTLR